MIESVARIVTTAASRLPALFEVPLYGKASPILTLWMTAEPVGGGEYIRLTEVESGESFDLMPYETIQWLQPEDMNSPSVQAEIITILAAKGIEL